MDITAPSFYALVCGVLSFAAPSLGKPFIRFLLGAVIGVLAALALRGGVWFAWIAAVLTSVLAAMIAMSGGDISLWQSPAITGAVLAVLSLFLTLRQRTA